MELEKLLNKLIEKGWKPFEREKTLHIKIYDCDLNVYFDGGFMNEDKKSFRELVSKESGLWQFVCKNGMIKKNSNDDKYNSWQKNMYNSYLKRDRAYAEYRLIGSALCDEDKLEKFLLDNIKI